MKNNIKKYRIKIKRILNVIIMVTFMASLIILYFNFFYKESYYRVIAIVLGFILYRLSKYTIKKNKKLFFGSTY